MSRHPTGAVASLDDPLLLRPAERAFVDRADAGRTLAALLERFRGERPVVLGMARGGVPVAAEVASALDAPLDVALVRKIGAPRNPEYALGAVAEGGVHFVDNETARALGLSDAEVHALIERADRELAEQAARYRGRRSPIPLDGRTAILVDDGLATGRSAYAAIRSLRRRGAARVILAVPVGAPSSVRALQPVADEVVCAQAPDELWSVGAWYRDFRPARDEQVTALLADADARRSHGDEATDSRGVVDPHGAPGPYGAPDRHGVPDQVVAVACGAGVELAGELSIPADTAGIVLFAHGSGSSRLSPRNREVARALNGAGYATLLFDLLTRSEALDRANVFDIELLAARLLAASAWLGEREDCAEMPLAFFGASTGAAAALSAAARAPARLRAVISRGGRPDLAPDLGAVCAPTLLIVGGADRQVLELNEAAHRQLRCASELAIVPGATHLFEEPGALEHVGRLAIGWLDRWCRPAPDR